jgi:hypothetical protein
MSECQNGCEPVGTMVNFVTDRVSECEARGRAHSLRLARDYRHSIGQDDNGASHYQSHRRAEVKVIGPQGEHKVVGNMRGVVDGKRVSRDTKNGDGSC